MYVGTCSILRDPNIRTVTFCHHGGHRCCEPRAASYLRPRKLRSEGHTCVPQDQQEDRDQTRKVFEREYIR